MSLPLTPLMPSRPSTPLVTSRHGLKLWRARRCRMAKYRKIDPRIWNDKKFRSLSYQAQLVFFLLLTHPNMTSLGAMRHTVAGLASEMHMPYEGFSKAFQEGVEKKMVCHDEKASFVWLPNFLKYNRPESPNVVVS